MGLAIYTHPNTDDDFMSTVMTGASTTALVCGIGCMYAIIKSLTAPFVGILDDAYFLLPIVAWYTLPIRDRVAFAASKIKNKYRLKRENEELLKNSSIQNLEELTTSHGNLVLYVDPSSASGEYRSALKGLGFEKVKLEKVEEMVMEALDDLETAFHFEELQAEDLQSSFQEKSSEVQNKK